jgi:hypothetical protein
LHGSQGLHGLQGLQGLQGLGLQGLQGLGSGLHLQMSGVSVVHERVCAEWYDGL